MQTKPAANQGLTLPFRALRRLREAGVFARAGVSLEYQQLAKRYVVRSVESGGAIDNLGHYVTFCGEDGTPLGWLHRWMESESTVSMRWWSLRSWCESKCSVAAKLTTS